MSKNEKSWMPVFANQISKDVLSKDLNTYYILIYTYMYVALFSAQKKQKTKEHDIRYLFH